MNEMSPLLVNNAGLAIFATIFAEQIGVPIPAAPVLVAAGALAADGAVNPALALGLTIAGCVLADGIWYYIGLRGGNKLIRVLCRIFFSNDAHVEHAERLFAKYGMSAIVGAKFVPGLSLLLPALAGAFRIRTARFLWFDSLGSVLYGVAYLGLGFLFKNEVNGVLEFLSQFGVRICALILIPILAFATCKYYQRRRSAKLMPDTPIGALAATTAT